MNILFVRNYPSVDGVFTLLLRLAHYFKKDGHTPYYIDFGGETDFKKEITETCVLLTIADINARKDIPHIDILFPFADGELLYWCINYLKHELFKSAKMVMGVYHPRAYFVPTYIGPTPDTMLHKLIFKNFPPQNILFMSEIVKREHESYFNLKFTESPIIPLPVKLENKGRDYNKINPNKVISIARLENSKRYVVSLIDVIEKLNSDGNIFELYIYGHGDMHKFLEDYIADKKVGHFVFLMGKLNYKDIYKVLEDAFLFVGMGTTIIEASSFGVPSLQAIESEKGAVTYGFFNFLTTLSIGEVGKDFPLFNMETSILELKRKTATEYQALCMAHIIRSQTFDVNKIIKDYYEFFKNASQDLQFVLPQHKLVATKVFRQLYKFRFLTSPHYRNK